MLATAQSLGALLKSVAQVLSKQVLRSGTSVGANYREASRARSKAAAELDALLPAILQSSPGFDATGERAFKREM